ncbi:leucine-rich repeat-containing protein 3B-like [Hyla sarda]|uniref:leucine-rich repeat-containing protein 3B-like n=1 Tax=Hyla sarda TaxID=327740 RepID=UPI0024C3F2F2|nr:leucine-rich repeat-containing protein 3B-like [Hyla sarda]XP_056404751.1 leucine-rich repeat-containing protein 3B-like [Hyla sarda]XP_056404752.1 leucine-rich repeat-containing protein 3B-like [Hyla sarda]
MPFLDWYLRRSLATWLLLHSLVLMSLCFQPATTFPKGCHSSQEDGYKTLRCSNALLTEVPKDIPNDTNRLYLDFNQITYLPSDAFRNLPVLMELDLSHNSLGHLDVTALRGLSDHLLSLDLSSNKLVSVNKEVFANLKARTNLSGNPWMCDCDLQELIRMVELDPSSSNGIVCARSVLEEHSGKPFLQVVKDVDLCNAYKRTTDVAMLVTMFGWFAMVISYLVYYVRQNQEDARRHLEYLKSLPSKQKQNEEPSTLSTVV